MAPTTLRTRRTLATTGVAILSALGITITGCSDDSVTPPTTSTAGTFIGESKTVGSGSVRSWAMVDAGGTTTSVGISVDEAAMAAFAADTTADPIVLSFPKEAKNLAYDHIGVDWNPKGHEPATIYDKPHFDIHFYTITRAQRDAITVQGDDTLKVYRTPTADQIPTDYVTFPGTGVPGMGAHWFDRATPELQMDSTMHHPFDQTFIYGFYDGTMAFMEPMITLAYLQQKKSRTFQLKLPARYPKSAAYATAYSIRYDAAKAVYSISLDGLTMR